MVLANQETTAMPAPDYPTLYRFEDVIIPRYAAVLTANSVTNASPRGTADLSSPRAELAMMMTGTDNHAAVVTGGKTMFDRWNFTMSVRVVTARNQSASSHTTYLGKVRYLMLAPSTSTTINALLSYHVLCAQLMAEDASELEVIPEEDHDVTVLKFSGIVAIKSDAWPVSSP